MNKTLLLAGVATALFAFSANAFDYTPYVSGKLTYSKIKADAFQRGHYQQDFYNDIDIEDKTLGGAIALGASTPLPYGTVRGEVEFGYKSMKDNYTNSATPSFVATAHASMEADIATLMFNGYYDIDTGTKFTPYIGAGIGLAHIDFKNRYRDDKSIMNADRSVTNFAWQLSAGAAYALTDNLSLDLSYRYTDLGSLNFSHYSSTGSVSANVKSDLDSQEVMLGMRYAF